NQNPEPQKNLFGKSEFTTKWEIKFDQIIRQLLNKNGRNFGIREIDAEVFNNIELGCNVNPPNLVILEPGPAPNSNEAVFELINMFLKDLGQN
ncbi:4017_t:CDS:1, partial [Dentiscutata heterogama]